MGSKVSFSADLVSGCFLSALSVYEQGPSELCDSGRVSAPLVSGVTSCDEIRL